MKSNDWIQCASSKDACPVFPDDTNLIVINVPSNQSLELAGQAWCQPTTENKVMDPDLAIEFAKILDEKDTEIRELRDYVNALLDYIERLKNEIQKEANSY